MTFTFGPHVNPRAVCEISAARAKKSASSGMKAGGSSSAGAACPSVEAGYTFEIPISAATAS